MTPSNLTIGAVTAGRGLDWIREGFGLFLKNPLIWIANMIILMIITVVVTLIPFIGSFAATLLHPVFQGGLMLGCRALDRGEELRIEHLFDGFSRDYKSLISVGLLSTAAYIVIGAIILVLVGSAAGLDILGEVTRQPQAGMNGALSVLGIALLVAATLSVPVAMATWFAPALVVFGKLPAWDAMKTSFTACLRNLWPFLIYSLACLMLAIVATIPLGLGLFLMGPTFIASIYAAYKDIFIPENRFLG